MTTGATLFTGFGGADLGMAAAGIDMRWGIENDPRIAAAARSNGLAVIDADIMRSDPHDFLRVDFLHASPPCTYFSNANVKKGETMGDVALANAVCRFVWVLRPRVFTLENVSAYRHSQSFRNICQHLNAEGYMTSSALVNFADSGVPQTRRRLVLRAVRGALLPPLPPAVPWQGWYQAVKDLLLDLPDSQFAPWQLERLPPALRETLLVGAGGWNGTVVAATAHEPAFAITANSNQSQLRAFIVDDQYNGTPDAEGQRGLTIRQSHEPIFTISATQTKRSLRAFIVSSQNGRRIQSQDDRKLTIRRGDQPVFTLTADQSRGPSRAAIAGRVIAMTPRCGARFQTFPDWYQLPKRAVLAWRGIGNAVPPLAMQRICEGLLDAT